MGGEKLKLSVFALLILAAGFLVQIQSISAQEEAVTAGDSLRSAEQALLIQENPAGQTAASGPSIWSVFRMILTLAFAAAAIYGVVFFIKRSSKQTVSKDPFLKILATAHLGTNRYAHIVSVGGKAWLLGSSDGGVNLIGEVDDKEIIDAMLLEESRKSSEPQGRFPDFISMLRRLGLPAQQTGSSGADDIRKHRERLRGL